MIGGTIFLLVVLPAITLVGTLGIGYLAANYIKSQRVPPAVVATASDAEAQRSAG